MKERKLALLLALSLTLSCVPACSDAKEVTVEEQPVIEDPMDEDYISSMKHKKENEAFDYSAFLMRIEMAEALYRNEFVTKEDIGEIIERAKSIKFCDNEDDDVSTLADTIIENSLNNHDLEGYSPFAENPGLLDPTSEERKKDDLYRTALKNAIIVSFQNGGDIKEDLCILKKLRIAAAAKLKNTELNPAMQYYAKYSLLILGEDELESRYKQYKDLCAIQGAPSPDKLEYLTANLISAINGIRKDSCMCRLEKGQTYRYILGNGGSFHHFINISNESQRINATDTKTQWDRAYLEDIKNEGLLLLMACFKNERTLNDYYEAQYDSSYQKLFDFFGLTKGNQNCPEVDEDALHTFYTTVSALEAHMGHVQEQYSSLAELEYMTQNDAYSARANILKIATSDLITAIAEYGDFTVREAADLFKFIKACAIRNIWPLVEKENEDFVYTPGKNYPDEFVEAVSEIEDSYYDFLATYYGLTAPQLEVLKKFDFDNSEEFFALPKVERFPLLSWINTMVEPRRYQLEEFPTRKNTEKTLTHKIKQN